MDATWTDHSDGSVKGYEWWCYEAGDDDYGNYPATRRFLPDGQWEIWNSDESDFAPVPELTTLDEAKAYAIAVWRMGGGS